MKNEIDDSERRLHMKSPSMTVVTPVNDRKCLEENLSASPMFEEGDIPLIVQEDYESAAIAYNEGLDKADTNIVIFAHQDVYFPRGWHEKLLVTIELLESAGRRWGFLGVIGADKDGKTVGGAWSTGLSWKIESEFESPAQVRSFDEIVLVLNKKSGLRFDENLPGFHLYGTDVAMSAVAAGLGAYVFDAPVIHNSLWIKKLGRSYTEAWHYLRRKWWNHLPIYTLVLPITRSSWPLLKNWYREKEKWFLRRVNQRRPRVRHDNPAQLARELGYDDESEK